MEGGTSTGFGTKMNTSLMTNVNPNGLADEFISFMPWIGSLVVFVFALTIMKRATKGASKGKVRL